MLKKLLVALVTSAFALSVYAQAPKSDTTKAEPKGQTGTTTEKAEPGKGATKKSTKAKAKSDTADTTKGEKKAKKSKAKSKKDDAKDSRKDASKADMKKDATTK